MKLSDIVAHWDLATYPKVALVIFLLVFVGVVFRLFAPGGRRFQQYASMAIDEETQRSDRTSPAPTPAPASALARDRNE